MSTLHADSIMKSFGGNTVLTDIFLSSQQGEIVGLLGRNGSGKSTLLKIIFGSLRADRRFVKMDDTQLNGLSQTSVAVKYLPQDGFLPGQLKVSTIISHYIPEDGREQVLSHPIIASILHKKAKHLSGGEQRFLEICLIAYTPSEFALLDEPFNGIAPVQKESIKDIIKAQSKQKGFVITDHDYRNVLDIATKIVLIYDGGTRILQHRDELAKWGYIPEGLV